MARRAAARLAGAPAAGSRAAVRAGRPAARRPAPRRGPGRRLGPGSARRVAKSSTTSGRVLRRASGAIFLSGAAAPSGPLRRRAELSSLAQDVERGAGALAAAEAALQAAIARLAEREQALTAATAAAEQAREAERQGTVARDDALRIVGNLAREMTESETQLGRLTERLTRSEQRLAEIDAALVEGDLARSRLEEDLGGGRSRLGELEGEQEAAREQRVHWQVQEAHVAGGLRSADERLQRAGSMRDEAEHAAQTLAGRAGPARVRCHRAGGPAGGVARGPRRARRWQSMSWKRPAATRTRHSRGAEGDLGAAEREVDGGADGAGRGGRGEPWAAGAPHRGRRRAPEHRGARRGGMAAAARGAGGAGAVAGPGPRDAGVRSVTNRRGARSDRPGQRRSRSRSTRKR